jgi:hypothetical protein
VQRTARPGRGERARLRAGAVGIEQREGPERGSRARPLEAGLGQRDGIHAARQQGGDRVAGCTHERASGGRLRRLASGAADLPSPDRVMTPEHDGRRHIRCRPGINPSAAACLDAFDVKDCRPAGADGWRARSRPSCEAGSNCAPERPGRIRRRAHLGHHEPMYHAAQDV